MLVVQRLHPDESVHKVIHLSHIFIRGCGLQEIVECGLVRLHSLLIILWWKSWPGCVCEPSMRLVALTSDV